MSYEHKTCGNQVDNKSGYDVLRRGYSEDRSYFSEWWCCNCKRQVDFFKEVIPQQVKGDAQDEK